MAKAKVTKRPAQRQDYTLQPSRLRMFLIYLVMFALAILLGLLIRLVFYRGEDLLAYLRENWVAGAAITVGGSLVMALVERSRWTLRVVGRSQLEGPTGLFSERIVIPINEIDWERTRRSLDSWLKVGNAIYGQGRTRVIVSQGFFKPEELKELLALLGYKN